MRISDWSSDVCSSDLIAQAHLECRQRAALKETQHPAVEHQFLMEAALLAAATGTGCATCARTGGRGLAWSCHQMSSTENMRSRNSGSIWRSLSTREIGRAHV